VVFDTFVEDMPPRFFEDRPWDVGNNPKTAVRQPGRVRIAYLISVVDGLTRTSFKAAKSPSIPLFQRGRSSRQVPSGKVMGGKD
jgi:hypothetical protein